ncbi:hypothetical protein GMORB2_6111 [Geosmithia morbida]|uniref:DUF8004 domain-containing protein n=1 Tax=Geosmithia morbida TaxID=1094350 RepID=A0A9P5D547_9HYPO|nr:uncharacterized protein GMORB2_6111 [Geosmithia morbida]KAF4123410.1 hypothetical protein GMORB2_6111 [Geosmithia morbida]
MTSSKSSRFSTLPSSFSLSTLRSSSPSSVSSSEENDKRQHVDAATTASSGHRARSRLRRDKSSLGRLAMFNQGHVVPIDTSLDEKRRRQDEDGHDSVPPLPTSPITTNNTDTATTTANAATNTTATTTPRKPRAWGNRISTFLPSLMTRDIEAPNSRPGSAGGKQRPPPPPEIAPASPPPYRFHDYDSTGGSLVPPPPDENPTIIARPPSASSSGSNRYQPHAITTSVASPAQSRPSPPFEAMPPPPPPPADAPPPTPTAAQQQQQQQQKQEEQDQKQEEQEQEQKQKQEQERESSPLKVKKRTTLTKKQDPPPQRDSASTLASSARASVTGSVRDESSPHQKLQKENRDPQFSPVMTAERGRQASLTPSLTAQSPKSSVNRVSSLPLSPPQIVTSPSEAVGQSPSRGRLRRSFMPGLRSRSASGDAASSANKQTAWVVSDGSKADYNPAFLKNGEKVPELWNESGNVLVYLYPRGSGCGPSFKVMEFTVNSSYIFNALLQGNEASPIEGGRTTSFSDRSLNVDDSRSQTLSPTLSEPSGDMKLYLPIAPPSADGGQLLAPGETTDSDLERLIAIRNMFAFLTGQPLVATQARPTTFHAFLQIASLLEEFGFTSEDGTTFGPAVDMSFDFYVEQLELADCRHSREKTVEALILGERMRSVDLYNEAFAHAAGKYSAIMDLKLPLFNEVCAQTRQQLEKAHFDLVNRQHDVSQSLEHFEFPSLFAGTASSSDPDLKYVRFKVWRNSFAKMRSMVLSHYKSVFGSWPPKASSSKNPFAESGLNRLVLRTLYSDMCAVYDLLVDRTNRTTRSIDEAPPISKNLANLSVSVLRRILSESDRSKPPVLPPIPYDTPRQPSMSSVLPTYGALSAKEQIKFDKSIKESDLLVILNKSYNADTSRVKTAFLDRFTEFERREAKGKMAPDLVDQRIGYWLFIYVVLQSLPTLVVDAPGLKFTQGSEYFLCEPPMGSPPWCEDQQVKKMWYEVAGGGGLVELSTDTILFSIEATYHRSHCWLAAKKWDGGPDLEAEDDAGMYQDSALGPLQPPPALQADDDFVGGSAPSRGTSPTPTPTPPPAGSAGSPPVTLRPRNLSPAGAGSRQSRLSHAYRSSMAMGLEPLPMEPPTLPFGSHNRSSSLGPRPVSSLMGARSRSVGNLAGLSAQHAGGQTSRTDSPTGPNTGATFDDILGETDAKKKKKEKKKGFFFG